MGVLFEKWRYGFGILVQKPGYSVLAIEKNCETEEISAMMLTKGGQVHPASDTALYACYIIFPVYLYETVVS